MVPEGKDCDWPSDIGTGGWTQDGFITKRQIILSDPRPPIASTEAGYNGEQTVGWGGNVCMLEEGTEEEGRRLYNQPSLLISRATPSRGVSKGRDHIGDTSEAGGKDKALSMVW